MNRDDLKSILSKLSESDFSLEDSVDLLLPFFQPVDFQGRSLVVQIDTDHIPTDKIGRLYAYADWLRHLGAKNVVFMPKNSEVKTFEFSKDQHYLLRFEKPQSKMIEDVIDWLRIAGADPEKILVFGPDVNLLKGIDYGNSEIENIG